MNVLDDPELRSADLYFGDPERTYVHLSRDHRAASSRRWRWVIRIRGVQGQSGYAPTPEHALEEARKASDET